METGRDKFKRLKPIILFCCSVLRLFGKGFNSRMLVRFRNMSGKTGLLLRYILVKNLAERCGDNVSIHPNVFLFNVGKLSLGQNISIHPMCYLDAAGGIEIGNDVSIAHNTSVLSTNHTWDNPEIAIKYNPETLAKVRLSDDVWIGCGCRILAGVTMGKRTVLAAGAVLNKDAESHSVYAGVPAKNIKNIA